MRPTLVLSAALLVACGEPSNRVPREITQSTGILADAVAGGNAFAWDVYGEATEGVDGNVFLSPFSMSAALGMTLAGADGQTLTEMSQVLHVPEPESEYHPAFGALIQDLNGDFDRGYTLHIANRLFGDVTYPWKEPFLATCAEDYGAPFEPLDFAADPDAARTRVNDWVAEQTNDRIEDLLPPGSVTGDTVMVLANAIYFLADWASAFDPDDTNEQGTFTLADGSTVTTPIMQLDTEALDGPHGLTYAGIPGGLAVRLPYQDDEVAMYVLVPDAPDGLPAIEAAVDADTFDDWIAPTLDRSDAFELRMPRFTMEYELDLVPALTVLGMPSAFEPADADFGRMAESGGDGRLRIDGVYHKAFVRVDEAGTEAAAATGVVMTDDSAPPSIDITHPFLFVLRDDLTGAILFLGRVADPTAG